MSTLSWVVELDQVHSSYLVVFSLATLAVAGGLLFQIGVVGWVFRVLGFMVRVIIRRGFLLWERLLSWASWPRFLVIAAGVREQAMRAIAMIGPPEILAAFTAGLTDPNSDIRKVASGGWMKADSIPEEVIPLLIVALRDPETQVRANAAHALNRLDSLPTEAIAPLIACPADDRDDLRINAAMALQKAPPGVVAESMQHLLEDANVRVRLIAARSLLHADAGNARAGAVLLEALDDPAPRVRKAALEGVESLGTAGTAFLEGVKQREGLEGEVAC
jgi:HEAT repeat protein